MYRYKISLEYDGTDFCGWQRQKEEDWQKSKHSIQYTIEQAIESMTQNVAKLFVAGRTDAGVHALNQVAHFDLNKDMQAHKIQNGLNYYLKNHKIVVFNVENLGDITTIPEDNLFHARFSAKNRHYIYKIMIRNHPTALYKNLVWNIDSDLNINSMQQAANLLIGRHDFSTFRASGCQASSPIKSLHYINIKQNQDLIEISVGAESFLYHMVRNIVGSLYDVGTGKMTIETFREAFEGKSRTLIGNMAPAHGLYFAKVDY